MNGSRGGSRAKKASVHSGIQQDYLTVPNEKGMMNLTICPLCNGLRQMNIPCKRCKASLQDQGKVTDYLDDYSAYEDIDTLKQVDGDLHSIESRQCIHLFYCDQCNWEEYVIIQE